MNIYYVNRSSKWKGPFDVIDAKQNHIISIGDICIRDTDSGILFLLVDNKNNSWNLCKRIGSGHSLQAITSGNTLLFSYDGIHRRRGNKNLLQALIKCVDQTDIVNILINAVDILEYKKGSWDFELFQKLFTPSQPVIDNANKEAERHIVLTDKRYPSIFASYFDDRIQDRILALKHEGKSLRTIYSEIREESPAAFRTAIISFLNENPGKTIYDTFSTEWSDKKSEEEVVETEEPSEDELAEEEEDTPWFLSNISYFDGMPREEEHKGYAPLAYNTSHEDILESDDDRPSRFVQYPKLSHKQTLDLFDRFRNGDHDAFEQLVKANLQLVEAIARDFHDADIPLDDLIQEGTFGLLSAIKNYNPRHKAQSSFTEYARVGIYNSIYLSINRLRNLVKIPSKHIYLHKKINELCDLFEQEHGYKPAYEDIELGETVNPGIFKQICVLPYDLRETKELVEDLDIVEDETYAADKELMREANKFEVWWLVNALPDRMRSFVTSYYGINSVQAKSLEEIAQAHNLTRERVRQIVEKARRYLQFLVGHRRDNENEEVIAKMKLRLRRIAANQFNYKSALTTLLKSYKCHLPPSKQKPEEKASKEVVDKAHITVIPYEPAKMIVKANPMTPESDLKNRILSVMRRYPHPMPAAVIAAYVNNLDTDHEVWPEAVEYVLRRMRNVIESSSGRYQLISTSPLPRKSEESIPIAKRRHKKNELAIGNVNPSLTSSTPLRQLVEMHIITKKECKHCHHKGLFTIGDVRSKIEAHHLTRESTRFTPYTLDIWFKIVDLLQ